MYRASILSENMVYNLVRTLKIEHVELEKNAASALFQVAYYMLYRYKLNRRKSTEIVFVDSRRRRSVVLPSPLSGVSRVSSLKMLGITVTETLSMADHVKAIIHNCASS